MNNLVEILAYADQTAQQSNTFSVVFSLFSGVISIVALWMLFSKAGEAGWKALIPFYNGYIEFKIVYGNGWKFLLLLVPILNIILSIAFMIRLAHAYGKSTAFGIGLIFLSPIFMLILAFGDSTYEGPYNGFL